MPRQRLPPDPSGPSPGSRERSSDNTAARRRLVAWERWKSRSEPRTERLFQLPGHPLNSPDEARRQASTVKRRPPRRASCALAIGTHARSRSRPCRPYLHRQRQCHGAARQPAARGHGIYPISPDRHLRLLLPDHRRRARRGWVSGQFRRRALHGALCTECQRSGGSGCRLPRDDHRNQRAARLRGRRRITF